MQSYPAPLFLTSRRALGSLSPSHLHRIRGVTSSVGEASASAVPFPVKSGHNYPAFERVVEIVRHAPRGRARWSRTGTVSSAIGPGASRRAGRA